MWPGSSSTPKSTTFKPVDPTPSGFPFILDPLLEPALSLETPPGAFEGEQQYEETFPELTASLGAASLGD